MSGFIYAAVVLLGIAMAVGGFVVGVLALFDFLEGDIHPAALAWRVVAAFLLVCIPLGLLFGAMSGEQERESDRIMQCVNAGGTPAFNRAGYDRCIGGQP